MVRMSDRVKELFENQEPVVLATSTSDGVPNVVPVNAKRILDDETILISDQFLFKTLKNLQGNPRVAIAVWDKLEGYQLKGSVTIETAGQLFEETARWIEERGKKVTIPLKSKGILIVKIEEIYVVTPGPEAGTMIA